MSLPYDKFEDVQWWRTLPESSHQVTLFDDDDTTDDDHTSVGSDASTIFVSDGDVCSSSSSIEPNNEFTLTSTRKRRFSPCDDEDVYRKKTKRQTRTRMNVVAPHYLSTKVERSFLFLRVGGESRRLRLCVSREPSLVVSVVACDICALFVRPSNVSRMIGSFAPKEEKVMISTGKLLVNSLTMAGIGRVIGLSIAKKSPDYDSFVKWFNDDCLPLARKLIAAG